MRLRRDHQDCYGCALQSYPPATQHSLVIHAQQLWNEWEIQFLVLLSMSLQVFLLFAAVFRKRCSSRVLSVTLWLSYLSADAVAVFVLGRLTLLVGDDPRQQLVLFWAPFLLLHLGGQETITAFSMEDCALWKRHLLNLATQVTLAVYVVAKQWRSDRALVAPTALIFVSGTAKYAERIWALKRAGTRSSGNSLEFGDDSRLWSATPPYDVRSEPYYRKLKSIIQYGHEKNMEHVIELATLSFELSMEFLMDMIPATRRNFSLGRLILNPAFAGAGDRSSSGSDSDSSLVDMAYKLGEIHLSLIYDYLYTKFGALMGVFYRLATLALTSTALVLFALARVDRKGRSVRYIEVDVAISYVLLVGAVTLEMSSVFVWLLSSYWPYKTISSLHKGRALRCAGTVLYSIVKRLPGQSRVEWSRRMQQYNIVDGCFQEKRAGRLEKALRCVGVERDCTSPVAVSAEVKKLVFRKMYHAMSPFPTVEPLALTRFHGQWVQRWVLVEVQRRRERSNAAHQPSSSENATQDQHEVAIATQDQEDTDFFEGAAQRALQISDIQGLDFASNVFLWHLVTDMCLLADPENTADVGSGFRSSSRDLSNYVMHLIIKCRAILGRDERARLGDYGWRMLLFVGGSVVDRSDFIQKFQGSVVDRSDFIQKVQHIESPLDSIQARPSIFRQAHHVSLELLKIEAAADRWELIATVWVEMLCYVAHNCEPGFHAKQLSAGGEFVSHVKLLLFLLCFPPV